MVRFTHIWGDKMKRTFATLGVVGLGLISLTAPAMAASDQVVVCHRDGSTLTPLAFSVNGIGGHAQHTEDIIPPTPKLPGGLNWTNAGKIMYVNECGAALPPGEVIDPVVTPPAEQPPVVVDPVVTPPVVVDPVVEQPVVTPPVEQAPVVVDNPVVVQPAAETPAAVAPAAVQPAPAKQAAAVPKAAPKAAPAAAPVSVGTNQGYNAQTAVGAPDGLPGWLVGLGALAAAGTVVAVRRQSRPLHTAG
jgi:hypothetical protein